MNFYTMSSNSMDVKLHFRALRNCPLLIKLAIGLPRSPN